MSFSEWTKNPTPDGARHLIRTYHESEWRETKIEVIRSLGVFQDSRSFQFLVELLQEAQDLSLRELALFSIAHRRSRVSKWFLKKFYLRCPDVLRPKAAYALGHGQVFEMRARLLSDFDEAQGKQDLNWLKNIVLSLGELKEFKALPKLKHLLEQQSSKESSFELAAAVLFSLSRLERDPEAISHFEPDFLESTILFQLFQNAKNLIQVRSQFKLEDYLSKIFEATHPHPVLPLELLAFDPSEVELGLSVFELEKDWKKFLFAARGLSAASVSNLILKILTLPIDPKEVFQVLAELDLTIDEKLPATLEKQLPELKKDLGLRFYFLQAFADQLDLDPEMNAFLGDPDEARAIQWINLWSEVNLREERAGLQSRLKKMTLRPALNDAVFARLIRALTELGVQQAAVGDAWEKHFQNPALRSSLLMYAERFRLANALTELEKLDEADRAALAPRMFGVLESLSGTPELKKQSNFFEKILNEYKDHFNVEFRVGVLRALRREPLAKFEAYVRDQVKHQHALVELNAVITLKSYPASREASLALQEKLESSPSETIQGRVLDSLCAHTTLVAKRAVMQFLKAHILNETIVDKVYRSFDPEQKGGPEFVGELKTLLEANPDHPHWEKLLALKERLEGATPKTEKTSLLDDSSPEMQAFDQHLIASIPQFTKLDATTKLAIRAAEQPFLVGAALQDLPIDKAPTVLEYCKALDLILEKHLGQKLLFPRLDSSIHEFQTLWHRAGFGEEYPDASKVLLLTGLKGKMTPEVFPLHKARMMCGTFFNGKIVQDRFKIFDGLRAWAVIFLFFTRKINFTTGAVGPVLKLPNLSEEKSIAIAKKLMQLQDLRNPAAHRQTYTDLASVKVMRNESIELINTILEVVL